MSMELRVLHATIDLAASQRTGESIEWLPFSAILNAFQSICVQFKISGNLESRCYRLLLLMDADSESANAEGFSPTWWEKVLNLPKYITKLDNRRPRVQFSKSNDSIDRKSSNRSKPSRSSSDSASSLLSSVQPKVLPYTQPDDTRQFQRSPSSVSQMSPSLLNEGVGLSLSPNYQVPQCYTPTDVSNLPAMPSSNSRTFPSLDSNEIGTSRISMTEAGDRFEANGALDDLSEKITSIQKESRTIRNFIAQLTYPKSYSLSSRRLRTNSAIMGDHSVTHCATKRRIHFDEVVDRDGVKPAPALNDHLTIVGESHHLDLNNAIESPALFRASTPIDMNHNDVVGTDILLFQALLCPGYQVQEFPREVDSSSSSVMHKYLYRSAASSASSRLMPHQYRCSKSISIGNDASSILTSADTLTTSEPTPSSREKNSRFRIYDLDLELSDASTVDNFDRNPSRNNAQSSLEKSSHGISPQMGDSIKTKIKTLREPSPGNISPVKERLQEEFEQESAISKGKEGNYQMTFSEQLISPLSHDMMPTPSLVEFFYSDIENMHHILVTPEATAAAITVMRLLVMFLKWIFRFSVTGTSLTTTGHAYRFSFDFPERIIPLMFYNHLTVIPDFDSLTNCSGLERWLREKLRSFLVLQSKRLLFQRWSNYVGMHHRSKVHYDRYQKHKGLNYILENVIRVRLRRKNAMMVFAYRRDQSQPDSKVLHSMGSLFRNLKCSKKEFIEDVAEDLHYSFGLFSSPFEKQYQLQNHNSEGGEFSTVSSVRQFVHGTQFALEMQQPDAVQLQSPLERSQIANPKACKLAAQGRMFVGQEASRLIGRVRKQAYEVAQDLVALFFVFRRLYRRTVYCRRFDYAHHRYQLHICLVTSFKAWKESFHQRLTYHEHMAPQISLTFDKVLKYRIKRAFQILQSNVHRQQHMRDHLVTSRSRIICKDIFVKALHLFRQPILVRMFLQWKENYVNHNVPIMLLRQTEHGYLRRAKRRSIHRLMHWKRMRQLQRGRRLQQQPGLMRLYEQVCSTSSQMQVLKPGIPLLLARETSCLVWKAYQQQRYLTRWWCLVKRTKVFSSLLDLKFYHTFTRATVTSSSESVTAPYEQSNLCRRFHTLTIQICTRVPLSVPRRLFLWKRKRGQQRFQRLEVSAATSQVDEKHYKLIFFEHPNVAKPSNTATLSKKTQSSTRTNSSAVSNRDLAALRMRLIDFPLTSFESLSILQDKSFAYLVYNGDSIAPAQTTKADENTDAMHRRLHHRMVEWTQPKPSYLTERDEDEDEDYLFHTGAVSTHKKSTSSRFPQSVATPCSDSRYTLTEIVSGGFKTVQSKRSVKRLSTTWKLPNLTPHWLLQRAGERLEHLHRIAFPSNSAPVRTIIPPNTSPGQFLAQVDMQHLWQQQQYLRHTFNVTMALKWAVHRWITNHRQRQQTHQQHDHFRSLLLQSQACKVWVAWHTTWKYINFWKRRHRCDYMKRLGRATVNRLVHKHAQSIVNRYLQYKAFRMFLLFSQQRKYVREYETVRFYNYILNQLTAMNSSVSACAKIDASTSRNQSSIASIKRRRQRFWHFLTHSETLVPYPLRHFLVQHPSFRFPSPLPPTEAVSEFINRHNRYTSKYPFPVHPAYVYHSKSQQVVGNNKLTTNHPNSSFFYNDRAHTSSHQTITAMRRISRFASTLIQSELSTSSLMYPHHENGHEYDDSSQTRRIIHYFAQVIPLFHLLTRAFHRWNSFTLHSDKLRRVHIHCYLQRVRFALQEFQRHHHDRQLRHRIDRVCLRTFLLTWRVALLQRHIQQQCYLKPALHRWRYLYQRAIVVRVWEKAWGYRIRSAMQMWRDFAKDLKSKANTVTEYLRHRRLYEAMRTWYLYIHSQLYCNYRQKQKFFRRIRLWLTKHLHFVYGLEHRRARWHHLRQLTFGRWLKHSQSRAKQSRWMLLAQWWSKFSRMQEGYLLLRQNCQQQLKKSLILGHSVFVGSIEFQENYNEVQKRLIRHRLHVARHWQACQWHLMRYQYRLTDRFEENYRQYGSSILYPYNPAYQADSALSQGSAIWNVDIKEYEGLKRFQFPAPLTIDHYWQDIPPYRKDDLSRDASKSDNANQQQTRVNSRGRLLDRYDVVNARSGIDSSYVNQLDEIEIYHHENMIRHRPDEDFIAEEEACGYVYTVNDNYLHAELMENMANNFERCNNKWHTKLESEDHVPHLSRRNSKLSYRSSFVSTKTIQANNHSSIGTSDMPKSSFSSTVRHPPIKPNHAKGHVGTISISTES